MKRSNATETTMTMTNNKNTGRTTTGMTRKAFQKKTNLMLLLSLFLFCSLLLHDDSYDERMNFVVVVAAFRVTSIPFRLGYRPTTTMMMMAPGSDWRNNNNNLVIGGDCVSSSSFRRDLVRRNHRHHNHNHHDHDHHHHEDHHHDDH